MLYVEFDFREEGRFSMDSIFGFDVQAVFPRKMFHGGEFVSKPIQSVCYDSKNGKFIVGFSHKNNNNGTLVRMNKLDFIGDAVDTVKANLPIGHCNDMVYHAKQHRIYVARGDKKIAVVNPDTLTVEKYITLDMVAWQISLYSDGSWFISDSSVSVKYDASFKNPVIINDYNLQDLINILHMPYDNVEKSYAGDWQGSFMVDDTPYMIYVEWNGITDSISGDTRYRSCVIYSPADHSVNRFPTYVEVEDACVIGNQVYFIIGNEYIGAALWDEECHEVHFKTAQTVHDEIPVGADLNKMFTPGIYRCKNATKAKTIKNLPSVQGITDAGFTLKIENTGLNHLRQTIESNNFWMNDAIITRGFNYDTGFCDWYAYQTTKANKDQMFVTVFGKVEATVPDGGNFDKGIGRSVTLDFSKYVPSGYTLYAANIDCECQGAYYTLPFINDWGKCSLNIMRIISNKITIRAHDNWGKCIFWITGFCKKI